MTFRTAAMMFVIVMAATPFALAADDDTQSLRANKKLEGELPNGAKARVPSVAGFSYGDYYVTEFPVTLKAGQKITISGTVTGSTDREIIIAVKDPTGKQIAATKTRSIRSTKLVVEEVSATGKYKVLLGSDQIGAFSVTADFLEVDDEKELEMDVARLKKELAEAEAKLKRLRDKKRG